MTRLWKSHPTSKPPITLWSWPASPCHGLHFQLQCITWTILSNAIWAQNMIGKQRSGILKSPRRTAWQVRAVYSSVSIFLQPLSHLPFQACFTKQSFRRRQRRTITSGTSLMAAPSPGSPSSPSIRYTQAFETWVLSEILQVIIIDFSPQVSCGCSAADQKTTTTTTTTKTCHLGGNMQIHNCKCLWIRITDVSYLYFFLNYLYFLCLNYPRCFYMLEAFYYI